LGIPYGHSMRKGYARCPKSGHLLQCRGCALLAFEVSVQKEDFEEEAQSVD
jgi:hypothetical protein